MKDLNSGKLIEHIEEAKDWLEKAKLEYGSENPVRGSLILNLAQAEVKHAWELSHGQYVSKNVQSERTVPKRRFYVPLAAVIGLFIALIIGVKIGQQGFGNSSITKISPNNPLKTEPKVTIKKTNPQIKRTELNQVVAHTTPEPKVLNSGHANSVAKNQIAGTNSNYPSRVNSGTNYNENVTPTKVNLKPVTQLTLDEDALTKEASHSLRNGQ